MYYLLEEALPNRWVLVVHGNPHHVLFKSDTILDVFDTQDEACEAREVILKKREGAKEQSRQCTI